KVAREYHRLRAEAMEHAVMRNRLLQRATEAYLRGQGADARSLSEEGQRHNDLMCKLHRQASQQLFASRNSDEAFIDLHGLHQNEAIEFLEIRLNQLKKEGCEFAYVITGTGHHSAGGKAKLLPAVEEWLTERFYTFRDCSVDGRGGMIGITVK